MVSIDDIARQVRGEIEAEFEVRVRACLARQPRQWLEEQLLALALSGAPGIAEAWSEPDPEPEDEREARLERIRAWELDEERLAGYVTRYRELDRERLEADGLLLSPPPKGSGTVGAGQRSAAGQALLREAKDLLYALLFGDESAGVRLERVERELLTLTLPRAKAPAVAFVPRAARGTGDDDAPDTVLQAEYGEVDSELVGNGIAAALRLINNLEVNEQVLYARMTPSGVTPMAAADEP